MKVSVSYWRVVFFFLLLLLLLLPLLLLVLLLPPVVLTVPVLAAVLSSVRKLDCTAHQDTTARESPLLWLAHAPSPRIRSTRLRRELSR